MSATSHFYIAGRELGNRDGDTFIRLKVSKDLLDRLSHCFQHETETGGDIEEAVNNLLDEEGCLGTLRDFLYTLFTDGTVPSDQLSFISTHIELGQPFAAYDETFTLGLGGTKQDAYDAFFELCECVDEWND